MELNSICLAPISTRRRRKFRHANPMWAWADRLNQAKARKRWSGKVLAEVSGVPKDSVYKYLDGKVEHPRGGNVDRLAEALAVSPLWLREGIGPEFTKLPIVGYVSAGESIILADDLMLGAGYGEIDFDLGGADPIVIEIRGESMLPAYRDRDHIICSRMRGEDIDNCIDRDCAVRTEDDEAYIKLLTEGDKDGTFTLESYNRAYPPMLDVRLQWAAPVVWVKRS